MAEEVDEESPLPSLDIDAEEEEDEEEENLDDDSERLKDDAHQAVANFRSNKYRGHNLSTVSQMENIKERLNKYKENRLARLSTLQLPHRHIIEMVALFLGIDQNEVVEGVIDLEAHVNLLNAFMSKGDKHAIIFFYQDDEAPPLETGRYSAFVTGLKEKIEKRVFVSDGLHTAFKEQAVVVYKVEDKDLEMRNLGEQPELILTAL
ncbi:uncharacterized protein [Atheta coriaria]|uniref:uncharacterized protein n=1 Tax=Dalotia coriaria TaxID=877792 RepID=UPI0031F398CB